MRVGSEVILHHASRHRAAFIAALQRLRDAKHKQQAVSVLELLRSYLRPRLQPVLPLALALAPAARSGQWKELTGNHVFLVGFWAWLFAQTLKIFTRRAKTGVWDVRAIVDSGGMPSSHSALCTSVTTAVALEYGLGSPLFAMALCFSLIVMYDATGVRRHAGKQAEVLNIMLGEILEGHPVRATKLKEVLGHTPLQVMAGAIIGVVVGCLFPQPGVMHLAA
ncbi:hypothetical protein WJX73_001762 [Symbiochloris irregularis]|uniref:Uncharacterized protein n=1 Tax=Symbiochloris irregularis TaxID=706552 RepID=A0AAW1PQM5_9CHLO